MRLIPVASSAAAAQRLTDLVTNDELDELLGDCPVLYHMAERGSWPSIQRHGLLSTSALLDRFGVTGGRRKVIEAERRAERGVLEHPRLGRATIRDQSPWTMRAWRGACRMA